MIHTHTGVHIYIYMHINVFGQIFSWMIVRIFLAIHGTCRDAIPHHSRQFAGGEKVGNKRKKQQTQWYLLTVLLCAIFEDCWSTRSHPHTSIPSFLRSLWTSRIAPGFPRSPRRCQWIDPDLSTPYFLQTTCQTLFRLHDVRCFLSSILIEERIA